MSEENEQEEDFTKEGVAQVTEAALRSTLRRQARENFQPQAVEPSAETIGLACLVTGLDDPSAAIEALADDGVIRWARLKVLDLLAEPDETDEEDFEKIERGAPEASEPSLGSDVESTGTEVDDEHDDQPDVDKIG